MPFGVDIDVAQPGSSSSIAVLPAENTGEGDGKIQYLRLFDHVLGIHTWGLFTFFLISLVVILSLKPTQNLIFRNNYCNSFVWGIIKYLTGLFKI